MHKCVGCGYCCIKTPCDAARRLYGTIKECPQLIWDDQTSRYNCGLMIIPGLIGEGYRQELHAGAGCCCGMNTWRKDVKKRTGIEASTNLNPLPKLLQIFIKCLALENISSDVMFLLLGRMKINLKNDGYSSEEINTILKNIIHSFQGNRNSFQKEFMG